MPYNRPNKSKKGKKAKRQSIKKKVKDTKMKSSNNKVMTVTCLKCRKKVDLSDYTTQKTKNGAILIQGLCPKGCVTKENKPMKVSGFAKKE